MAAILGPGDHLRQHNLPQMVRGDQLWRGTNCGVTDLIRNDVKNKNGGKSWGLCMETVWRGWRFAMIDMKKLQIILGYGMYTII